MERGYVKLWRKIEDCQSWSRSALHRALIVTLMVKATWKSSWYRGVEVKHGALPITTMALAEELGVSRSAVVRALQDLQADKIISLQNMNNRWTLVCFNKWDTYQKHDSSPRTTDEQPADNRRTTDEQPSGNNIIDKKEGKKEIKIQRAPARMCARAREAPEPQRPKPQPFPVPKPAEVPSPSGGGEGSPKRERRIDPDILSGKKAPPMWKQERDPEPDWEEIDGQIYHKDELIRLRKEWTAKIRERLRQPITTYQAQTALAEVSHAERSEASPGDSSA